MTTKTKTAAASGITIGDVLQRRLAREASEAQERALYAQVMQTLSESDDTGGDEFQAARDLAKLHGFNFEADLLFLRQRRKFMDACNGDPEAASAKLFEERQKVADAQDAFVMSYNRKKGEMTNQLMQLNTRAMSIIEQNSRLEKEAAERTHLFTVKG
jgi:cytosine/adenosine deaminase-related metal-dependent hydrolase